MAIAKNIQELQKMIQAELLKSAKKVAEKNTEILKKHVEEEVYNAGQPIEYTRTHELENSSTTDVKQESDVIKMTTYNDSDKMTSDADYPRAYSFGDYSPKNYNPYLVGTIVEGTSGDVFGSEGFWHEKRDFITPAREEIENTVVGNLKEEFRKNGVKTN